MPAVDAMIQPPSSTGDPPDQMPALTGIRFPLAMWVVAHHLSGPNRMFEPLTSVSPSLHGLIDVAWVALSAFFALSGFVLARRYRMTPWTRPELARFAVARFGRVYPVYLLSLFILAPIMFDAMRDDRFGSVLTRAGLLVNHVFLLQGWIRPDVNWNTPAWSLSSELFFYACTPLLVGLVRVTSWPRVLLTATLACALPIALRLSLEPPIAKPLLYLGDFLIGIAAAGLYDRLRAGHVTMARIGPWVYGPAMVAGLAILLYRDALGSFLVFDTGIRLTSAGLVFGLACGGGWLARVLSSPLALAGGQASYAIYILHVPVLWWYQRSDIHAALPPVAAGVVYVLFVVLLSLVVARGYEGPANLIVRRWWERRSRHAGLPGSSAGQGFAPDARVRPDR